MHLGRVKAPIVQTKVVDLMPWGMAQLSDVCKWDGVEEIRNFVWNGPEGWTYIRLFLLACWQCFQSNSVWISILSISKTTVHVVLKCMIGLKGLSSLSLCQVLAVQYKSIVLLYDKLCGGFLKFWDTLQKYLQETVEHLVAELIFYRLSQQWNINCFIDYIILKCWICSRHCISLKLDGRAWDTSRGGIRLS